MKRLAQFAVLLALVLTARTVFAAGACPSGLLVGGNSCYFIAASGSDNNNGTSESTPWLHAPGMPNCASTCAGVTPSVGQGFIFRGGDTWHRSASTSDSSDVPMGGQWTWSWQGSSSNCNYPSVTSSCIYVGVDTTWYNSAVCGASFCRPKMNMDNPIWANSTHQDSSHPGFVTTCTYDDYNSNGFQNYQGYVIFDNWELLGKCWTQVPSNGEDQEWKLGGFDVVEHFYVHGWTEVYNPQCNGCSAMDQAPIFSNTASPGKTDSVIAYSVFDGSDSCPSNTASSSAGCTGGPVGYGDCYAVYGNVFRWMSNVFNPCYNSASIHDNLFEDLYESYDPADHGGIIEAANPPNDCPDYNISYYNNVVRNSGMGITWEISVCTGYSLYIFNNVLYGIGNGGNCIIVDGTQTPIPNVYFTNNTMDKVGPDGSSCTMRFGGASNSFSGNVTLQNNHMIGGYSSPLNSSSNFFSGSTTGSITDNGNEVFQAESVANGQGYQPSNQYQPTSTSGATYHAGANPSPSCSTYSGDSALCSGSSGAYQNTAGSGTIPTSYISAPPARGTTWDAGAYQYSGLNSTQPNAPTGLVASVQ